MNSTGLYRKKPPQKYNFKKQHQFTLLTFLRMARRESTAEVGIKFLQGGELEICPSSQASTGCSRHICFLPPLKRFYIMKPTHQKPEIITIQTKSSFLKSIEHFFRQKLTTGNSKGIQLLNAKLLAIAPPISIPSSLTW